METTTPFDLTRAIQQWREKLSQSSAFRREDLDELELHVRDSIAALQTHGLSAEEAFMIAAKRIGKGGLLEMEFAKVNRRTVWLDRALWMLIGIQMWGLVVSLTGSVARNAMSWGWGKLNYNYRESGLALPVTLFSLVQVLGIAAGFVVCWWLVVRKGDGLGAWLAPLLRRRSTLVATCAGLCLLSIGAGVLTYLMQNFLARSLGPAAYGSTAMCFSYSQLIIWPTQVVAMIILTLVLARKRLRACRT